jgi:serine/threonine protein kinase
MNIDVFVFFLGDIDSVRKINSTNVPHTEGYCAPEIENKKYIITQKADIYSLGVIIFELMYGKHLPLNEIKKMETLEVYDYLREEIFSMLDEVCFSSLFQLC